MKRQSEMMESFAMAHRQFVNNLERSTHLLEADIKEAGEMGEICTSNSRFALNLSKYEVHVNGFRKLLGPAATGRLYN